MSPLQSLLSRKRMLDIIFIVCAITCNIILIAISIFNLAQDKISSTTASSTYTDALYLLCIFSFLSLLFILIPVAILTVTNRLVRICQFKLVFDFAWTCVAFALQLISASVISADPANSFCKLPSAERRLRSFDVCPSHGSLLAFSWMAVIFLLTLIILVILDTFDLKRRYSMSLHQLLTTKTVDLPDVNKKPPQHPTTDAEKSFPGGGFEAEKHPRNATFKGLVTIRATSPASSSSSLESGGHRSQDSGSRRNQRRPPPLDLSSISATQLPIFAAHTRTILKPDVTVSAAEPNQYQPTKGSQQRSGATRSEQVVVRARGASESTTGMKSQPSAKTFGAGSPPKDRHQVMRSMAAAAATTHGHQRTSSHASSSGWVSPGSTDDWVTPSHDDYQQHYSRYNQPRSSEDKPLPRIHGREETKHSVVNRPDPRDRKESSDPTEFKNTTGGFWRPRRDSWE